MDDLSKVDLSEIPCSRCLVAGGLRIEMRKTLQGKPLGTFSLSGRTMKVSASWVEWPWMVCDLCQGESRGKRD
jgi:hypothetical protein